MNKVSHFKHTKTVFSLFIEARHLVKSTVVEFFSLELEIVDFTKVLSASGHYVH